MGSHHISNFTSLTPISLSSLTDFHFFEVSVMFFLSLNYTFTIHMLAHIYVLNTVLHDMICFPFDRNDSCFFILFLTFIHVDTYRSS